MLSWYDSKRPFFYSDRSLTLRWPRQAAASRCSSCQNWKTFSQIEISRWLSSILTAMSMTRPAGPLMAASSGQRGGSSVTGKGRGGSRSSRGGITSNWMVIRKKLCSQMCFFLFVFFGNLFIFKWQPVEWQRRFYSLIHLSMTNVVVCQCYHPMAAEHIFFSYSSCRQLIKEAECVKIVSLAGCTQQRVRSSSCTHKHVLCITYCKSFFIISPHNPLMNCIAYCFIYM